MEIADLYIDLYDDGIKPAAKEQSPLLSGLSNMGLYEIAEKLSAYSQTEIIRFDCED